MPGESIDLKKKQTGKRNPLLDPTFIRTCFIVTVSVCHVLRMFVQVRRYFTRYLTRTFRCHRTDKYFFLLPFQSTFLYNSVLWGRHWATLNTDITDSITAPHFYGYVLP